MFRMRNKFLRISQQFQFRERVRYILNRFFCSVPFITWRNTKYFMYMVKCVEIYLKAFDQREKFQNSFTRKKFETKRNNNNIT